MIKNIVFDLGNVLFEWDVDKITKEYTNNESDRIIIKNEIFKSNEWFELDKGLLEYSQAKEIFESRMPHHLKEKVDYILNTWYKKMTLNNKIVDLIKKLKNKGYNIYLLSNTHIPVFEYIKTIEIYKYFDGIIISAIEKMMKPDIEIYNNLCKKYNLIPSECIFIDDIIEYVSASKSIGMKGYVFQCDKYNELMNELNKEGVNI